MNVTIPLSMQNFIPETTLLMKFQVMQVVILLAKSSLILVVALMVRGAIFKAPAALRSLILITGILGAVVLPFASFANFLAPRAFPAILINVYDPALVATGEYWSGPRVNEVPTILRPETPIQFARPNEIRQLANHSGWVPKKTIGLPTLLRRPVAAPSRPMSTEDLILTIWAIGFGLAYLYRLIGSGMATRLARRASRFPGDLSQVEIPYRTKVLLNSTSSPSSPITWGFWKPKILLPQGASEWSQEAVETVVLHEVAHIRRNDSIWQGLAYFACSLNWFNPLFWFANSILKADAEQAADDLVLLTGCTPTEYAARLMEFAASASRHGYPALGFAACSELENRVKAILDPKPSWDRQINYLGKAIVGGVGVMGIGIGTISLNTMTPKALPSSASARSDSPFPVTSSEKLISSFWRIDLSNADGKSVAYVLRKGDSLMGWSAQKGKNGNGNISTGGSVAALDSWEYQNPTVTLKDGSRFTPFRVIQPEYRKLLAESGIKVSPTTVASLKSEVPLGVPPDMEVERAEFIKKHGLKGADLTGATVWFQGNVLGIIDRKAIEQVKSKKLHWPQAMKEEVPKAPTGYWRVILPGMGLFYMNAYHLGVDGLYQAQVRSQVDRHWETYGGKTPTNDQISDWSFETTPARLVGRTYHETYNDVSLDALKLDNPQYRADAASRGFLIEPISREEFNSFTDLKLTPQLALGLAAAEQDEKDRIEQFKREPHRFQHVMFSSMIKTEEGTFTINGKTQQISFSPPPGTPLHQKSEANDRATKAALEEQDRALESLAREYADAKAAETQASNASGDQDRSSAAHFGELQTHLLQVIHDLEKGFGQVGKGASADTEGSTELYRDVISEIKAKIEEFRSKRAEADALYSKGQLSANEVERIKEQEMIEHEKARWINERIRESSQVMGGLSGSGTQQRIEAFESKPVNYEAKNEDVRKLLEDLYKDGQMSFTIAPGVQGRISFVAKNVPRRWVISSICKEAHLKETVFDGHFTISPDSKR